MALTIRSIAVDLDSHVRYPAAGKPDEVVAYQVNIINRALEEIRVLCPQAFRSTIPITWTAGTTLTTAVSGTSLGPHAGFADYAAGCSLNIAGDSTFNELATVGDGSVVSRALFAYSGSPGSMGVTIYGDCVKLGETVDRVLGCELLHEKRPLQILNSRHEWLAYQREDGYFERDYGSNEVVQNVRREPGVPRAVWLETCLRGNEIEYRAHCAPLPNGNYRATLDVATMAEDITVDDITDTSLTVSGALTPDAAGTYQIVGTANGLGVYIRQGADPFMIRSDGMSWQLTSLDATTAIWVGPSDPSPVGSYVSDFGATGSATILGGAASTTRPVPGSRVYGILRALCLYHWSGSPWFKNDAVRKVIEQGYVNATQQLTGFRSAASQSVRSIVCY